MVVDDREIVQSGVCKVAIELIDRGSLQVCVIGQPCDLFPESLAADLSDLVRIRRDIAVPFPFPRLPNLRSDPAYLDLVGQVSQALRDICVGPKGGEA